MDVMVMGRESVRYLGGGRMKTVWRWSELQPNLIGRRREGVD